MGQKNKILHTVFVIALVFISGSSLYLRAQTEKVFFSVSGDTVAYSSVFGQSVDSLNISYTTYLVCREKSGQTKHLSYLELVCSVPTDHCIETLQIDTVKKYHLQLNGDRARFYNNPDFHISIIPSNTYTVNLSRFGPKYIFETTVTIEISCKDQSLYSKSFHVQFKGESPKDFPKGDILRFSAWQQGSNGKYFIDFHIKEKQVFKKPGDTEDSEFVGFQFII